MKLIRTTLLALLLATPACATSPGVTLYDGSAVPLGTPSNPLGTMTIGSVNIATGQGSIGTGAAVLVPARVGRVAVTVENTSAVQIFIGGPGVTPTTGFPIPGTAGASFTVPSGATLYAVTASGTATAAFIETF